ncbi:MAG: hypothetical protein FJZ59_03175 [Chlamydiae bacterium]|nr:hypothetical protein [Chlamydiota bacterium]
MTAYIHPKNIEKARDALWKEHQGSSAVRASLFNLVIYTKNNERQDYFQKIAKGVIKKFPCRIIMITESEESKEAYLKTFVSDLRPDDNSNSLFCDMINFEVSGDYRNRIPFVVTPNLLADLPVYFLSGDDPCKKDPVSIEIKDLATRTVYDSEVSESMVDFAKTLLELYNNGCYDIGDLNWARLAPWRGLFVHTFNDPEKLKCLRESKDIRITYNVTATKQFCHTKIGATYFQAWIATKLKWNYESMLGTKEELCFKYSSSYGPVTITLIPGKYDQVPPGRLLKFESFSSKNEHILLEKSRQNPQKISIHHATPTHCEMPAYYLLDKEIAGKSMIHEIYSQGTRGSFVDVLKLISKYNSGSICS